MRLGFAHQRTLDRQRIANPGYFRGCILREQFAEHRAQARLERFAVSELGPRIDQLQLIGTAPHRPREQHDLLLLEFGRLALRIKRHVDQIAQGFAYRDIARDQRRSARLDIQPHEARLEPRRTLGFDRRLLADLRAQHERRFVGEIDDVGIGERGGPGCLLRP